MMHTIDQVPPKLVVNSEMESIRIIREQNERMIRQSRDQIIREYEELERRKKEFLVYKEREMAMIENVKNMYHRKIEVFMFI
jgi:hypothetical protein